MRRLQPEGQVLIAGAGPAGLAAAWQLAVAGVPCTLVDPCDPIGSPLHCAELTRPDFFDLLGVRPEAAWIRWRLPGFSNGLVLNRPALERGLAERCALRGVTVLAGTAVRALGPWDGAGRSVRLLDQGGERELYARCVIAADGVASRVAASAGFQTRLPPRRLAACLAYRVVEAQLADSGDFFKQYLPDLLPCYFWVIPSGPDEANVGLGVWSDLGHTLPGRLSAMMASTAAYAGGRLGETIVGGSPVTRPLEEPYTDGVLVVGAAARLVEPLMGEGIYQAVTSGRAAAATLLAIGQEAATSERLRDYRERLEDLYQALGERHARLEEGWTP